MTDRSDLGSRNGAEHLGGAAPATGVGVVGSVLGADYARLGDEVADLSAAGVVRIQWDVMDGHFVPNVTFGADVVGACQPHSRVPFEAHLMVQDPDSLLADFVAAGCETIIVHVETAPHLHRTLSTIRELGAAAGVAVNPSTPLDFAPHILDQLDQLDQLLIMTVTGGSRPPGRRLGRAHTRRREERGRGRTASGPRPLGRRLLTGSSRTRRSRGE